MTVADADTMIQVHPFPLGDMSNSYIHKDRDAVDKVMCLLEEERLTLEDEEDSLGMQIVKGM